MKDKSVFTRIILVIVLAVVCFLITGIVALVAGNVQTEIFDFSNLNFANMLPVLLIGVFISCVIIGIAILFLGKAIFFKAKDYFEDTNNKGDKK